MTLPKSSIHLTIPVDKQCYYLPNALERFVIRMRRHAGGYMIISIGYEKYIDWRDDCVTGVNAWVR